MLRAAPGPLFALVAVVGWSSCGEGRLVLELELPADRRLDPTLACDADECDRADPRLVRLSLRISRGGRHVRTQDTAISTAAELAVGDVPVDSPFDLRLAAQSATGQVLGLGVVRDLRLSRDGARVAIRFRKPVAYIAGGDALRVIDTAAPAGQELPSLAMPGVVDVAAADDGALVAAISSRELIRIRTSDHLAAGCAEPLPGCANAVDLTGAQGQPASCLAVSPDSTAALVCHQTGLTAVTGLNRDDPTTKFFQLGRTGQPSAVRYERDGRFGWVLVNAARRGCAGAQPSVLVRLDLQANQPTGEPIEIGYPAAALVLDPVGQVPLVALPCNGGHLGRLEGGRIVPVVEGLPAVFAMAVVQQSIVLVGRAPRGSADEPLAAQVTVIDRSDPARSFPAKERIPALSRTFELPAISVGLTSEGAVGYLAWVSPLEEATIHDLEISPDGQRAVLLLSAIYSSDVRLGAACEYRTELTGNSYLLADLDAGKVLLSQFTQLDFRQCRSNCAVYKGQLLSDPAVCAEALSEVLRHRGQLIRPGFEARAAALLFGY